MIFFRRIARFLTLPEKKMSTYPFTWIHVVTFLVQPQSINSPAFLIDLQIKAYCWFLPLKIFVYFYETYFFAIIFRIPIGWLFARWAIVPLRFWSWKTWWDRLLLFFIFLVIWVARKGLVEKHCSLFQRIRPDSHCLLFIYSLQTRINKASRFTGKSSIYVSFIFKGIKWKFGHPN